MSASPISNSSVPKCFALLGVIVMMLQVSISSGEPVKFRPCADTNSGKKESCEIKNVAITPCPEALDETTCNAYRGSNMTIEFDWYPQFSANNYTSQIYSNVLFVDIPDPDHSRPGCQYTKCPIVAGQKHTFKSTRFVKPEYPASAYVVKYRLWDEESSKRECCFVVDINIV